MRGVTVFKTDIKTGTSFFHQTSPPPRPGGIPYDGLYARKGYLFQASAIYERVGISLVEVHKRVGLTDEFYGF